MRLTACLLCAACQRTKAVQPASRAAAPVEQTLGSFTMSQAKGGKPDWTLEADSARIVDPQKRAYLKGPRIKFYQNGAYSSTLVAGMMGVPPARLPKAASLRAEVPESEASASAVSLAPPSGSIVLRVAAKRETNNQ